MRKMYVMDEEDVCVMDDEDIYEIWMGRIINRFEKGKWD